MLISHKIIDCLLGVDDRYELMDIPGVTPDSRNQMAYLIQGAQKFDFGDLHLEVLPDTTYALPKLMPDEIDFWEQGLIPLPYEVCWYEFVLGGHRSGLLVWEKDAVWKVMRVDLVEHSRSVMFDRVTVEMDRKVARLGEYKLSVNIRGNTKWLDHLNLVKAERRESFVSSHLAMNGPLAIYLTLMLNSKTTEIRTERAPEQLNKARAKKGRAALVDHRVVQIIPIRFQYEIDPLSGRQRRSPRLHWRRSHLRHYENGKVVVIARMLVGKAELGEVSHEYRIQQGE